MSSAPLFDFFEVVKIKPELIDSKNAAATGVVLGRSMSDSGEWGYAVHVYEKEEGWDISESDLIPTGKFVDRSEFYTGDVIKVIVDEKTGEGYKKPDK